MSSLYKATQRIRFLLLTTILAVGLSHAQTTEPEGCTYSAVTRDKKLFLDGRPAGIVGDFEESKRSIAEAVSAGRGPNQPFVAYVKANPTDTVAEVLCIYAQLKLAIGARGNVGIIRSDNSIPVGRSEASFAASFVVSTGNVPPSRLPFSDAYGQYSFSPAYSFSDESDRLLEAERLTGNSIEIRGEGSISLTDQASTQPGEPLSLALSPGRN